MDHVRKLLDRKSGRRTRTWLGLAILCVLCIPSLAESSFGNGKDYTLTLSATPKYSTINLTACLTVSEGRHRNEAVFNATIHFYTCDAHGKHLVEIGQNLTKRNGKATYLWSAPGNGKYWFIAAYDVVTKGKHDQGFAVTS